MKRFTATDINTAKLRTALNSLCKQEMLREQNHTDQVVQIIAKYQTEPEESRPQIDEQNQAKVICAAQLPSCNRK